MANATTFKTYDKPFIISNLLVRQQGDSFVVALPKRDCLAAGVVKGDIIRVEIYLIPNKDKSSSESGSIKIGSEKRQKVESEPKVPVGLFA